MGGHYFKQAALNGNIEVVKVLVEQHVDVNTKVQDGWTPLYLATANNHMEVVKL